MKFSTTMSESATRRLAISSPAGLRRSSVMQRLLRASLSQLSVAPVAVIVPKVRIVSPLPGSSTLTTSAPNSPSTVAQNGPASTLDRSRTRTPSSAFFFGSPCAFMKPPPGGKNIRSTTVARPSRSGHSRIAVSPGLACAFFSRKISGSATSATSIISLKSLA